MSNFGKRTEVYNGIEGAVNARFGKGGRLTGGVSTGQTVIDNCAIIDSPALLFCKQTLPWRGQTQVKFAAVYPLPWSLEAAATFQNLPGTPVLANRVFVNSEVAPSLGRNLSACPTETGACNATVSVPIIEPNTLFEDRLTQVDVRLVKIIRIGRLRARGMLDLYNLFNASTILARNNTFGSTWGLPTAILGARVFKFGVQLDF
jgi:hypothetical protein